MFILPIKYRGPHQTAVDSRSSGCFSLPRKGAAFRKGSISAMKKTNYHTHTTRCLHAEGSDEAYVQKALEEGFTVLGFSDHSPWQYDSDYVGTMRMPAGDLPGYVASVRALQQKYAGRIELRLGLECEYFPRYIDWLKEQVRLYQMDYLIFGNHFYPSDENSPYFGSATRDVATLCRYVDSSIEGMESGLYACFAHPDLFLRAWPGFDDNARAASHMLCRAAKQLNIPVEYNLLGTLYNEHFHIEGYPHEGFWRIAAAEGCTAIIGVDAHAPQQLANRAGREKGLRLLQGLGMEITDTLRYFDWGKKETPAR